MRFEYERVYCTLSYLRIYLFLKAESGLDGCKGLRTHSCRRTAAYYAAWQGVPEATIKVGDISIVKVS